jgi:signal transduction histidine kinase
MRSAIIAKLDPIAEGPSALLREGVVSERGSVMLPRSVWLPMLAMSLIAVGAFVFNEWSVQRIRAAEEELAALTAMQLELIELRSRISDADAATRGFLLTREQEDLRPVELTLDALPEVSARLSARATSDPMLLRRVRGLDDIRAPTVAHLRGSVTLAQQGRHVDAVEMLRSGEGRAAMTALRNEIQSLFEAVQLRVNELRSRSALDLQWSRVAAAALGSLTLVLLVLAVRLLGTDLKRRELARREQATERLRLEELVQKRTEELSRLTTYLQTVSEEEKAALARDLHDELGSLLTAAKMDLAWLQGRASANEPEVRAKLDALAHAINDAMDLKRRVVENLRPALLEHFGLPLALHNYFEETCKMANLDVQIDVPDSIEKLPPDQGIAFFRIGQEALTNIMRHARATRVKVLLEETPEGLHLRISDNGIGVAPQKVGGLASHGIVGMRHRVESLHGVFEVLPNQPSGTVIDVVVPHAMEAV